ncbi:MAG TPA: DUF839 domain-containing protein [Acidocella sp.]|nr:DUF839 domain-containing protein [Acidocella sp.]
MLALAPWAAPVQAAVATVSSRMRRRALLGGLSLTPLAAITAHAQSVLGVAGVPTTSAPTTSAPTTNAPVTNTPVPLAPNPQAAKLDDTVAPPYNRMVIMRWGDPLLPDAPPFNPNPLTEDQASSQFPYDSVVAGLIAPPPAEDGVPRLIMVLANPTAPANMLFQGGMDAPAVAGKLQGATVLNLQYQAGRWVTVQGGYQSRRLADGTLCQISGPAAAAIGSTVQGILAPQGGCTTPWGTALLAEGDAAPWLSRLANVGFGYNDPTQAPKFGWVTEFNPLDPQAIPVKRTALGRFAKSAIAATATPDGRPVIFISQDADAGYFFRFIAASNATDGTALDTGTLAVAQVNGSNIKWLDLPGDSAALIGALNAANIAGGTVFDAPGGIAIAQNGTLYLACRGNPNRSSLDANGLNPRAGDDNGYVLALHAPKGDLTARNFTGEIAIAAGNPAITPGAQYTPGSNAWLTHPRTLNLDSLGQLWIGTDSKGDTSVSADGLFIMQTGGPSKYLLSMAYLAPVGAALGGAAFDAATHTNFAMVRHPGATPTASFSAPATRWPTLLPTMPPQSTIIALVG